MPSFDVVEVLAPGDDDSAGLGAGAEMMPGDSTSCSRVEKNASEAALSKHDRLCPSTANPEPTAQFREILRGVGSSAIGMEDHPAFDHSGFAADQVDIRCLPAPVYWGAPTAYSIPSVIGGTIQNVIGIPNQFPLENYGAEPIWGYTASPASLTTGLPEGGQYLAQGLLGYLNPNTYLQAVNNNIAFWTDPAAVLGTIPLLGYLVDTSTLLG